jgi:hypothetical protein
VKWLPTPPGHFRWTNTPGTRRLKVQFDGDWLSLRSKNRIERTETLDSDANEGWFCVGCSAPQVTALLAVARSLRTVRKNYVIGFAKYHT